jgi:hypothetical protein
MVLVTQQVYRSQKIPQILRNRNAACRGPKGTSWYRPTCKEVPYLPFTLIARFVISVHKLGLRDHQISPPLTTPSSDTRIAPNISNRKIGTRKQRTDVGKYSFVNRIIRSWNQLAASLLASFPSKLNTFRKRVKTVVTSKGFQVGVE